MSNMKYFTNGELSDPEGTGITVNVMAVDESGKLVSGLTNPETKEIYPGYKAIEISKEEYLVWKARIENPDMITYFPGVFKGVGVVDKATYSRISEEFTLARLKQLDKFINIEEAKLTALKYLITDLKVPKNIAGELLGITDVEAYQVKFGNLNKKVRDKLPKVK